MVDVRDSLRNEADAFFQAASQFPARLFLFRNDGNHVVFFLLSCLCLGFLTFNALNLRHSCSLSVFLNNSLHLLGFWFRFFFLDDGASPFHEKTTSSASTRPLNWDCRSFRFFSSFGFLHDRGLFTMAISTSHHLVEVIILVCFVRFSLGPGSSNG